MDDIAVDRNTATVNAATAFIVGALLGAGVALLFAPQSGRKTRRDICQQGGNGTTEQGAAVAANGPLNSAVEVVAELS